MMRPRTIFAIARRDLRLQFVGRQRLILPLLMTMLLGPVSAMPLPREVREAVRVPVAGDVPDNVASMKNYAVRPVGMLIFSTDPDGTLNVRGANIPFDVRNALDENSPFDVVMREPEPVRYPTRGLLLALLAASTLTGSLSQSLPGERSDRTLVSLRAAAITPMEIVFGKALAWGGWGGVAALAACAATIAGGRLSPGWWLLAVPTVPFAAAAFGLFLVRRASDVVGGATVALRTLPAALAGVALGGFFLYDRTVLGAALLPGGGALLAAGDMFDNPAHVLVAVSSTLALALALLSIVARDLEPSPVASPARGVLAGVVETSAAALPWWLGLSTSVLWTQAGATALGTSLNATVALTGATAGLAAVLAIGIIRAPSHQGAHAAPRRSDQAAAVVAGLFGSLLVTPAVAPLVSEGSWADVAARLAAGVTGDGVAWPLAIVAIVVQEALFRGRMPRLAGDGAALVAWTLVTAPLDPLFGLGTGMLWLGVARLGGSWWIPAVARVVALVAPAAALGPWGTLLAAGVGAVAWAASRRPADRALPHGDATAA